MGRQSRSLTREYNKVRNRMETTKGLKKVSLKNKKISLQMRTQLLKYGFEVEPS